MKMISDTHLRRFIPFDPDKKIIKDLSAVQKIKLLKNMGFSKNQIKKIIGDK
jgi:hypothetical protein